MGKSPDFRSIRYDSYPDKVFRELIVNACIHRNYSILGSRIRIFMFNNRIEFISPGKLPNTVTTDKLGRGLPMVYREAVKQGKDVIFEEIGEEFKVSLFF